MKQNDAVFGAVCEVLGGNNFSTKVELSKDQQSQVIEIVTNGILNGTVDFSTEAKTKYNDYDKVKLYTTGMVNNHLRKDLRLNGGTKYQPKNPGSRAGSGDEQLKALKALRSTVSDPETIQQLDLAIEVRTQEIKATKIKKVEINYDALPEHLRHLVK